MKLTGARATRFLEKPAHDIIGVLLFGPDRGLVKSRSQALAQIFMPDADDAFGVTVLTADDLSGDPAKLADEIDIAEQVKLSLGEKTISINPDALDMWTPLLEGDHALAAGEIEKMALYKGYGQVKDAVVTVADIRAIAAGSQSASLDTIIMQMMSGLVDEADASYRRAISGKTNPVAVLISLQRHLLRLIEAAMIMDKGENIGQALRALRPPVFAIQEANFKRHLSLWPLPMLRRALVQSQKAEREIKTASAATEAIMGRLILALSSYAAKRT